MNNLEKILITAQGFGFGPASKAGSIASYCRGHSSDIQIDFGGQGIAYELGLSKQSLFNNIFETNNDRINALIESYDLLISVMEPNSVLLSKKYGVKSVYVDSLFWFWDWSSLDLEKTFHLRDELKSINMDNLLKDLSNQHPHTSQFFGHFLSDRSFIQAYPHSQSRKDIRNQEIGNVEIVGPIIDDRYKSNQENDILLITFCGQKNPIVSFENSINYCNFCLSVLEKGLMDFSENNKQIKIQVIGHQAIMDYLENKYPKKFDISFKHLKHEEYYKTINRSFAIFGPPSITTIYESMIYEKPYIFLPEQHDGHYPNYLKITQKTRLDTEKAIPDIFSGFMFTPLFASLKDMSENHINKLYGIINKYNTGNYSIQNIRTMYSKIFGNIKDNHSAYDLFLKQRKSIAVFKDYPENGAFTIAKQIMGGRIK